MPEIITEFPQVLRKYVESCTPEEYIYLTWTAYGPGQRLPRKTGRLDYSEGMGDMIEPSLLAIAKDRGWAGECWGLLRAHKRQLGTGQEIGDGVSPKVYMPRTGVSVNQDEDEEDYEEAGDIDYQELASTGLQILEALGDRMTQIKELWEAKAAATAAEAAGSDSEAVTALTAMVGKQSEVLGQLAGALSALNAEVKGLRAARDANSGADGETSDLLGELPEA